MATTIPSNRRESSRSTRQPPPAPIRVYGSSFSSSKPEEPFLYDLPSAMSPTSAVSPSRSRVASPTSPTFVESRRRAASPAPSRMRPATVVQESDLDKFAAVCRAWYFKQDDEAGQQMTQTLATLPSSQRAAYSRVQAAIRSSFHAEAAARRNAEFRARMAAVQAGASLAPHARADPHSLVARKERCERLEKFIANWCTTGMPGTKPFFEGLWAVMRLQVVPENLGGAGGRRIEWEIDDSVFKEAAGKDFMFEAVDVFKGVLGFEDSLATKRSESWSRPGSAIGMASDHARTRSVPLASASIATTTLTTSRARAPSDPFLDTQMPGLSRSVTSTASPASPTTPKRDVGVPLPLDEDDSEDEPDTEEYIRVYVAPDLHDEEFLALLKLFPAFVSQRPLPRFPIPPAGRGRDVEEDAADEIDGRDIRFGTGRMWVGVRRRSAGFVGVGWWARFTAWLRSLFC